MANPDPVIDAAREKINVITEGLALLVAYRIQVIQSIGERKAELGLQVVNGVRDQEVKDRFYADMCASGYTGTREFPDKLMDLIIEDSKARQAAIIEAYQK